MNISFTYNYLCGLMYKKKNDDKMLSYSYQKFNLFSFMKQTTISIFLL